MDTAPYVTLHPLCALSTRWQAANSPDEEGHQLQLAVTHRAGRQSGYGQPSQFGSERLADELQLHIAAGQWPRRFAAERTVQTATGRSLQVFLCFGKPARVVQLLSTRCPVLPPPASRHSHSAAVGACLSFAVASREGRERHRKFEVVREGIGRAKAAGRPAARVPVSGSRRRRRRGGGAGSR